MRTMRDAVTAPGPKGRVLGALARTLLLLALGVPRAAVAWVYPEHRQIALTSVRLLDPERRAVLDRAWGEARAGHEERLCEQAADAAQGLHPSCIDWAALSAIAGDHSCSSEGMAATVLDSRWILQVAAVAAHLERDLARIDILPPAEQAGGGKDAIVDLRRRLESETARAARINALRTADIRLQAADAEYATRAGSNNAHFLLARPNTDTTSREYAALTMRPGSEISAVGVYTWFHLSAMQKATRVAAEPLGPDERRALMRAVLFDEAFALHFLEDVFASGHVAGTWGNASQRKGTHDFYSEAGLEAFAWNGGGSSMVLMGDAHMRPEDRDRAAAAVRTSLEEVLDTLAGRPQAAELPHTPGAPPRPDAFDVCKNGRIAERPEPLPVDPESYYRPYAQDLAEVLKSTPIPGLGPGLGAMPRFRSEVGPFFGLSGGVDGQFISGGFTASGGSGFVGGVELSARAGVGLEGVMGDAGDGLVFLAVGVRGDSSSTNAISSSELALRGGSVTAAIPARVGLATRVRMPFYLIPGDLVLLAPLYFFAPERYLAVAVTAGNGGLLRWQSGWATPIGRFQLVLGRELGVTIYGLGGNDRVIAPPAAAGGMARVVSYRSIDFDVPVLDYRPYRAFASNQSSAVLFQLFFAADVPYSSEVVAPAGAPDASLRTVWSFGLRLVFDWRYYP